MFICRHLRKEAW